MPRDATHIDDNDDFESGIIPNAPDYDFFGMLRLKLTDPKPTEQQIDTKKRLLLQESYNTSRDPTPLWSTITESAAYLKRMVELNLWQDAVAEARRKIRTKGAYKPGGPAPASGPFSTTPSQSAAASSSNKPNSNAGPRVAPKVIFSRSTELIRRPSYAIGTACRPLDVDDTGGSPQIPIDITGPGRSIYDSVSLLSGSQINPIDLSLGSRHNPVRLLTNGGEEEEDDGDDGWAQHTRDLGWIVGEFVGTNWVVAGKIYGATKRVGFRLWPYTRDGGRRMEFRKTAVVSFDHITLAPYLAHLNEKQVRDYIRSKYSDEE